VVLAAEPADHRGGQGPAVKKVARQPRKSRKKSNEEGRRREVRLLKGQEAAKESCKEGKKGRQKSRPKTQAREEKSAKKKKVEPSGLSAAQTR